MVGRDLRIDAAHHHRLDDGQEFRDGRSGNTEGGAKCKGRAHIPADHRAGDDAQLTPKAPDKVPDLPTLKCERLVQSCRAVGTDESAGCAVAVAPTELPLGMGDEAFFSASKSKPFAT
ncbi:MAG: hypothetical protein RIT52_2419 [Pseudomonadota bacterium]|jgi:hypothetical protein